MKSLPFWSCICKHPHSLFGTICGQVRATIQDKYEIVKDSLERMHTFFAQDSPEVQQHWRHYVKKVGHWNMLGTTPPSQPACRQMASQCLCIQMCA